MRKFYDDEAEMGSDNSENDDVRKNIKRDDEEENEDGLDEDLKDFVVHEADDQEVINENGDHYALF
jgi:hypothetical protein